MSTWDRIDDAATAHPLDDKADKASRQRFAQLMAEESLHVRLGGQRQDGTEVRLIGAAKDLHGADGVCVCCCGRAL